MVTNAGRQVTGIEVDSSQYGPTSLTAMKETVMADYNMFNVDIEEILYLCYTGLLDKAPANQLSRECDGNNPDEILQQYTWSNGLVIVQSSSTSTPTEYPYTLAD